MCAVQSPKVLSLLSITILFALTSAMAFATAGKRSVIIAAAYGEVPLTFEVNQGQSDSRVKFLARGQGYALFLTPEEAVMRLHGGMDDRRSTVVRVRFVGANRKPEISGVDRQPGNSNYLIGKDPARWRSGVPTYGRVRYAQIYRGIDLVYRGNQRQLEYDFEVAPGADLRRIELAFEGIENLSIDSNGNLVLTTARGPIVQRKPVVYQEMNGERIIIAGHYVLRSKRRVGFEVSPYDTTRPLVIDPTLVYSTYLGGTGNDIGYAIATDSSGNVYVTGTTSSANFPLQNAIDTTADGYDVFVSKLTASGSALVYSTFIGGSTDLDIGYGIAVDGSGNAYVTGQAGFNFPTVNAIQSTFAGGQGDAFVLKLNSTGSALMYSTYLGSAGGCTGFSGGGFDTGFAIAVDGNGSAYVTGYTQQGGTSPPCTFPTTIGAAQTVHGGYNDAFVAKLNPAGNALVYSTFLGGGGFDEGTGIAVDASGNAYVTGDTAQTGTSSFPTTPGAFQTTDRGLGYAQAFVTKLNSTGSQFVYSTYLGGDNPLTTPAAYGDKGHGIVVDGSGNAIVVGETNLNNFPTTMGAYQPTSNGTTKAFVTKFNSTGTALIYSTFVGSNLGETHGYAIALGTNGNTYITGDTLATDFPTTAGAYQPSIASFRDAFVTELNSAATALVYSTYLGGNGHDYGYGIALDLGGNFWVTGSTASLDFPTVNPFQAAIGNDPGLTDAFIAKFSPLTTTTTTLVSSLNPSVSGDAVMFTATVTGSGATGTVQFKDGAANLGAPVTLSGGTAALTTSSLTVGTHSITATYSGDSAFFPSTSSVLSQVVQPPFGAPAGLVATAVPGGLPQVALYWNLVGHADHYEVARRSNISAPFVTIAMPTSTNYLDIAVTADTTYLYVVRAVDASGTMSPYSNMDPATTIMFTDDPLAAGTTIVKAVHVTQLRTAVDAMRAAANLAPGSYSAAPIAGSTTIMALHIQELRTALDAALTPLGLPSGGYTDVLTAGSTIIRAVHVQELRDRVK